MSIGVWEITLILVIVFVIFGAGKLPQVMSDLGKGVKGLKQGMKDEKGDKNSSKQEKKAPEEIVTIIEEKDTDKTKG